jgi:hypothetical protein
MAREVSDGQRAGICIVGDGLITRFMVKVFLTGPMETLTKAIFQMGREMDRVLSQKPGLEGRLRELGTMADYSLDIQLQSETEGGIL